MTFGTARDLSSQVVAIPMTSFRMLMTSPDSEVQRISPQKRRPRLSFRQSVGPPGASLGQKATRVAEIVTRVTESFGTANGYHSQASTTQAWSEIESLWARRLA